MDTKWNSSKKFTMTLNKGLYRQLSCIRKQKIKTFLQNQETAQLNRPVKKEEFNRITAHKLNDIWQADLLDMKKWAKFNKNHTWILTIVDIYSRYAGAIPLKSKSTKVVKEAFETLKILPKNLTTDNGKEFIGNEMKSFLQKNNVKHWTHEPGNHNTLGIIERFNKTIRILLNKYMTANKTKNWYDVINKLTSNYNNTYHDTIRSIPNDLHTGKQNYSNQTISRSTVEQFEIGNKVRLKNKKSALDKISENYSRGIYEIVEKTLNSYKVKNEKGDVLKRTIKPNEMLLVEDVQSLDKSGDEEEEAKKELKGQKVGRILKKEGLDPRNYPSYEVCDVVAMYCLYRQSKTDELRSS